MHRLRKAEAGDCQAICQLAAMLVGLEADRRACFEATLADPDHEVVVAEVDDMVVGYAHLMVYPDLTHGALAGELLGLVVREDRRRVVEALPHYCLHEGGRQTTKGEAPRRPEGKPEGLCGLGRMGLLA